jgi:hypothetical protein
MTRIRIDMGKEDADTILDILALFVEYVHLDDKQKDAYIALSKAVNDCIQRHIDNQKDIDRYYKQ